MAAYSNKPTISIVIPTLNSDRVLEKCLVSINNQEFSNYEILICDGGSTDNTIKITQKFNCQIIQNKLKTAEAAKAVGLQKATGKYIAFIDSDNILPNNKWLSEMIFPLELDQTLIGSEPWEFTYRKKAGFIERYSALIGANDPYAYVIGISDRMNLVNKQWTTLKLLQITHKSYIKVKLLPHQTIPTIGANGTVFKTSFLKQNFNNDYLFDIDIITQVLNKTNKPLYFAKTKNGIIHTYCESSVTKFYKKQMRRLKDYYTYKQIRKFNYKNNFIINNIKFVFYVVIIIPMLITTVRGYIKKPDIAWAFHPLACLITLYCYVTVSILYLLKIDVTQSRNTWRQ